MAKGKGNTVINLTKDDFKKKSFKTAPGGTYFIKISAKSELKEMNGGTGINLAGTITKGPHKGVNFFDNIGPNVKWKFAQLFVALGIKKTKLTIAEILKLIKGGELRAILRERTWEGKKRNEVVQYLPLTVSKDEEGPASDDDEDEEEDDELEDGDASEAEEDEDDEDEEEDSDDDEDDDDLEDEADDEEEDDDEDADEEDAEDEDEDDEEEDEGDDEEEEEDDEEEVDEEEEEPAPTPRQARRAAKKAAAKKVPAKKAAAKKSGRRK